jgi:hypothetical protein
MERTPSCRRCGSTSLRADKEVGFVRDLTDGRWSENEWMEAGVYKTSFCCNQCGHSWDTNVDFDGIEN